MHYRQLDLLSQRLLHHGFSRRYVRRYVAELNEHAHEAFEDHLDAGMSPVEAQRLAWHGLGSVDTLLDAAVAREDLLPFARRRPILSFLILPIPLLALTLALWLATIYGIVIEGFDLDPHDPLIRWPAFVGYGVASFAIVPLVMMGFTWLCHRYRCRLRWLGFTAGLLTLFGGILVLRLVLPGPAELVLPDLTDTGQFTIGLTLKQYQWAEPGFHIIRFISPGLIFGLYAIWRKVKMTSQHA